MNFTGKDPAVRAWINTYPDPISKSVVGRETHQTLGIQASAWGAGIDNETEGDKDWFDTIVLLDLLSNLNDGTAAIKVLTTRALSRATMELPSAQFSPPHAQNSRRCGSNAA